MVWGKNKLLVKFSGSILKIRNMKLKLTYYNYVLQFDEIEIK